MLCNKYVVTFYMERPPGQKVVAVLLPLLLVVVLATFNVVQTEKPELEVAAQIALTMVFLLGDVRAEPMPGKHGNTFSNELFMACFVLGVILTSIPNTIEFSFFTASDTSTSFDAIQDLLASIGITLFLVALIILLYHTIQYIRIRRAIFNSQSAKKVRTWTPKTGKDQNVKKSQTKRPAFQQYNGQFGPIPGTPAANKDGCKIDNKVDDTRIYQPTRVPGLEWTLLNDKELCNYKRCFGEQHEVSSSAAKFALEPGVNGVWDSRIGRLNSDSIEYICYLGPRPPGHALDQQITTPTTASFSSAPELEPEEGTRRTNGETANSFALSSGGPSSESPDGTKKVLIWHVATQNFLSEASNPFEFVQDDSRWLQYYCAIRDRMAEVKIADIFNALPRIAWPHLVRRLVHARLLRQLKGTDPKGDQYSISRSVAVFVAEKVNETEFIVDRRDLKNIQSAVEAHIRAQTYNSLAMTLGEFAFEVSRAMFHPEAKVRATGFANETLVKIIEVETDPARKEDSALNICPDLPPRDKRGLGDGAPSLADRAAKKPASAARQLYEDTVDKQSLQYWADEAALRQLRSDFLVHRPYEFLDKNNKTTPACGRINLIQYAYGAVLDNPDAKAMAGNSEALETSQKIRERCLRIFREAGLAEEPTTMAQKDLLLRHVGTVTR